MQTFETITCAGCKANNIISLPDPDDYGDFAGAFICWNCGKKDWRGDIKDEGFKDCLFGEYDEDKTPEENLADANYETGRPDKDYGSEQLEAFLETMYDQRITWRGFLLGRLYFLNGAADVWALQRPRRLALVEQFLDEAFDCRWIFREPLAAAFNNSNCAALRCQKYDLTRNNPNGGYVVDGVDWPAFDRNLKSLVHYMMGI